MFKGVIALFASRAVWNFKTLFAIIFGVFCFFVLEDMETIIALYSTIYPYALFLLLSLFYNLVINPCYKTGGKEFDFNNFLFNFVVAVIHMILVSYMTISFFYIIAFG